MNDFELTSSARIARAPIISEPAEVEARLGGLHPDLDPTLLRDAVSTGLRGRNDVTRASAPTAAGIQQWLSTVEALRTLLVMRGWHLHEQQNCPFISSPDRTVSIVVMTGSSETGTDGLDDPTNQAEKGAVAERFTQQNFRQLELFNHRSLRLAELHQGTTQVWALLYHYDNRTREVRSELSLPTNFGRRKITGWGERLLLESISNNPNDFTILREEPSSVVSVDVVPKPRTP